MKKIIISLFLLILPVVAQADMAQEIARCAEKEGDLDRLSCYDAVAEKNGVSKAQNEPADVDGEGKWQVSEKTNPIDDSKTVVLALVADSGKSRWGKPVVLIARCKSNATDVYINWNDYLGDTARVLTRIGSQDAVTKEWSLSTNSQATFHPIGEISFIKEMMKADKLVAQVTPYNESPITAVFDTAGLDNAIKPLRETCHW